MSYVVKCVYVIKCVFVIKCVYVVKCVYVIKCVWQVEQWLPVFHLFFLYSVCPPKPLKITIIETTDFPPPESTSWGMQSSMAPTQLCQKHRYKLGGVSRLICLHAPHEITFFTLYDITCNPLSMIRDWKITIIGINITA